MSTIQIVLSSAMLFIVAIISKLIPCLLAAHCFSFAYNRWMATYKGTTWRQFLAICIGIRILLPCASDDDIVREFCRYIRNEWERRPIKKCGWDDLDLYHQWGVASRVKKLEKRVTKLEQQVTKYEKI